MPCSIAYARPLIIDLPLPPTVNRYGAGRLGNSSSVVQAWRKRANFHLMSQKLRPAAVAIHGKYVIHIVWADDTPRRGDIDNRIKPLLDYLHDIELTADDSQCEGLSACYGTAPEGCRVRLLGYPANDNGEANGLANGGGCPSTAAIGSGQRQQG